MITDRTAAEFVPVEHQIVVLRGDPERIALEECFLAGCGRRERMVRECDLAAFRVLLEEREAAHPAECKRRRIAQTEALADFQAHFAREFRGFARTLADEQDRIAVLGHRLGAQRGDG